MPEIVTNFCFLFWFTGEATSIRRAQSDVIVEQRLESEATANDELERLYCATHQRTKTAYRRSMRPDRSEREHIDFAE